MVGSQVRMQISDKMTSSSDLTNKEKVYFAESRVGRGVSRGGMLDVWAGSVII